MDTSNKLVKICDASLFYTLNGCNLEHLQISSKNQASPRSKNWRKCVPIVIVPGHYLHLCSNL